MRGRTYRFFTGEPLFPFGYGLSYTTFAYRNLKLPKIVNGSDEVKLTVDIQNNGKTAGDEVVELYVTRPVRALEGFIRVPLAPGASRNVQFVLTPHQLAFTGVVRTLVGVKQPGFKGSIQRSGGR